jgi:leucyl/phenylalanyl-tRNA--protein transferase
VQFLSMSVDSVFVHKVWQDEELVGGLYGMAIGGVFFGESMFSRLPDTSKVALVHLSRTLQSWDFRMIDCQVYTQHLANLGAQEVPRQRFCEHLESWCRLPGHPGSWAHMPAVIPGAE